MADSTSSPSSASSSKTGSSGTFGFLTRKLGPAPVWVWAAGAFAIYYWYTHYGPGASSQSSAAATPPAGASTIVVTGGGGGGDVDQAHGGGGDDDDHTKHHKPPPKPGPGGDWKTITVPAKWNGWTLSQIAKYLHWTPETLQDVEEANAVGGKEITANTKFKTGDTIIRPVGPAKGGKGDNSGSPDQTATTPSGPSSANSNPFSTNPNVPATGVRNRGTGTPAATGSLNTYTLPPVTNPGGTATGWQAAAINYLIGEGVPPDQASTSVWSYLHSEPLSSRMQANVNLATDGIGPPPNVPGPAVTVANARPKRNTPRRAA